MDNFSSFPPPRVSLWQTQRQLHCYHQQHGNSVSIIGPQQLHIAVWSYCSCSSCSTITWGDHLGEKMPLPVLVAQWQTHFLCAVMPPSFLRETSFLVGRLNSIVKERFHELKCFKPLSSQTFSQISCSKRSAFSQVADLQEAWKPRSRQTEAD